jgi:hypothetical protein
MNREREPVSEPKDKTVIPFKKIFEKVVVYYKSKVRSEESIYKWVSV